jgi:hypothetical protein
MSDEMDLHDVSMLARSMRKYEKLADEIDRKNKEMEQNIKKVEEVTMILISTVHVAQAMSVILGAMEGGVGAVEAGVAVVSIGAYGGMDVYYASQLMSGS